VDGYTATARIQGRAVRPRRPDGGAGTRIPVRAGASPELVDLVTAAPLLAGGRVARLRERLDDACVGVSQLTWYLFSEDAWR
jgi:hypothetical protein